MSGYTLDAGALIAVERGERTVVARVTEAVRRGVGVVIPAGVLAQVWCDGRRQVRLQRLLASEGVEVVPLDDFTARAAGQLLGATGARDVVDASVVVCARARDHVVLTSDPEDLRALDPGLALHALR